MAMIMFSNIKKTNVALIDKQHQELIDRINAVTNLGLLALQKEEMEKTLNFLGDYIRFHFAEEEKLQRSSGYPKCEEHKEMHRHYIADFEKLKAEFHKNGASAAFAMTLNKSIIDWIVTHIQTVDVELGAYINAHK